MENTLDPDRSLLGQLLWSPDPATQSTILLVIVAAALAVLFIYGPLLVRLVRLVLLERAVREACQLDDRPAEAHREEIAIAFMRSPLQAQWEEFVSRWRGSLAEGAKERSPIRLLDVFDERPLIPTGAQKSLLPAIPGLFLAVGVLGTFVGLAAAIDVSATLDSSVVASTVADRVGLALRSSLWGLLLAIVSVISGRLLEGIFDRVAESLDHGVERAFGSVSAGELSSLSARAQRDSLIRLGAELTRFTSDLTERLDRGLQRIEHSTASAANLVSEEQRNVLQNVVRELSVQVQTGVEEHLSALHEVLERAVDHQGAVTGGLAEAFDQMAENTHVHARVTQILEQAAASVQGAAAAMSHTADDFSPVLEHLRDAGNSLSQTADTMNATQDVVSRSADGIRSSIDQATAALFEQRQFIETGLGEIRATLEGMSTGLGENLNQALRNVDEALDHTVGRLQQTIEDSNETIDRMSGPVRAAEGTTREMHTALERVRDEVTGLGDWLSQAVKPLRGSLSHLEDHAGDITRALGQFGDHAQHVDKTMDALRGEIHEEGRRFRSSTSELSRHIKMATDAVGTAQRADPRLPATPRVVQTPNPQPPAPIPGRRDDPTVGLEPSAVAASRTGARIDLTDAQTPPTRVDPAAVRKSSTDSAPNKPPATPIPSAAPSRPTATIEKTSSPEIGSEKTPEHHPEIAARAKPQRFEPAPETETTPRPLPIKVHGEQSGSSGDDTVPAEVHPADTPRNEDPGSRTAPALPPGAGQPLGPDPYARMGNSRPSLERQRRILESGRSMHDLEIDESITRPDTPDDLALSGLLSKHRGSNGNSASQSQFDARPADARKTTDVTPDHGMKASPPDELDDDSNTDRERPRTWQLLGRE